MKRIKNDLFLKKLGLLLIALTLSVAGWTQQTVKGKVVDSEGIPLPGVAVVLKGTTTGTVSNNDGEYVISLPSDGVLEFSFVGMVSASEPVNGRTTINVTMQQDAIGIEEVVAVGYGTMKRTDVTGAVASVKGDKIAELGTFSAAQALQGQVAGVQVVNNGDAGSNPKIRIRGVNTIGNNDPLIVVDGITNGANIQDIHPGDIESIDVLKDASALAIFGSRASSGVILITTKKGNYGAQKLQVSFDASYGVAMINKRLDMVNSTDLVAMIDEARTNENAMQGNSAYKKYDEIWPGDNWGRQDITDWQDELFSTGAVQDYALSAQGGSKNATYAFSASYRDQEGTMPGNYANRFTARGSMETKVLNDKLKLGSIISFSQRESQNSSQGDIWHADLFGAVQTPGNIPAYKENGKAYQETDPNKISYFTPGGLYQNNAVIWNDYSNHINNTVTTLYADLEIIKGLNFRSTLGLNYGQNYYRNYKLSSENPEGGISSLDVNTVRSQSYSWDNVLTFDRQFSSLKVNAVVGSNIVDSKYNGFTAYRQSFPSGDPEGLRYLNFGLATSQTNSETAANVRLASYFGRINLNYQDKYLLTATVRQDGSSRFHEDVRWGTFPSFSLGWRLSEEDFMSSVGWLDLLKIRGSWGEVGNQNVGSDYAYLSTVRSGYNSTWGDGDTDYALGTNSGRNTGKVIWQRGNEDVTWETTTILNIGLDFAMKSISGSLELFRNNTTDVLLNSQIPDIAGYYPGTSQKVNSGEIQTQGIDFSLNYTKSLNKLNLSAGLNLTYAENEIISLSKNDFVASGSDQNYKNIMGKMSRSYVGDPIGSFYGYNAIGIFNTQAEVDAANKKARDYAKAQNPALTEAQLAGIYYIHAKTAPGDRIFEDRNGDGIITDKDQMNLGSGNPKMQYGLNFSADYEGFDMALNFTGVAGVQIYSMFEPALSLPGRFGSLSSMQDHWTPTNQTDNFPRYTISDPNGNGRASNIWIHDGSYFRLQNLIVGYTLPTNLVSKIKLSSLRVFANAQNLFTITNYPFLEPEVISNDAYLGGGSVDLSAGVDAGSAPMPLTVMFGLNVKF